MEQIGGHEFRFGAFTLNGSTHELRKFDQRIRLRPQACTVLVCLASRSGELVTREELQKILWADGTIVDFEHGINFCIRQIRRALGDTASSSQFIETVPKKGYRFLAVPQGITSVAVLPFENKTRDPSMDYVSDGISESLIRNLASTPNLRVLAWSSVSRLRSTRRTGIGRKLGVGAVLSGNIRTSDGHLEIGLDLVDVQSDQELWGTQYKSHPENLSALQEQILADVSRVLRLQKPVRIEVHHPDETAGPQAQHAYLKGRYYLNKYSEEGLRRAVTQFNETIDLDPLHALAYTGLAECYGTMGFFGLLSPHDSWPKANAAASRALEIDPTISEAHASAGMVKLFYHWAPTSGLNDCERAIQYGPSSPSGYRWRACCEIALGQHRRAISSARSALEMDPLSAVAEVLVSTCCYFARDYVGCVKSARKALQVDPNHAEAHRFLGIALIQLNELGEATSELQLALKLMGETPATLGSLGRVYARSGMVPEAMAVIQRLRAMNRAKGVAAGAMAAVYLGLGRNEDSLMWLNQSVANRSSWMAFLNVEPWWEPIREHPQFQQLLRKVLACDVRPVTRAKHATGAS